MKQIVIIALNEKGPFLSLDLLEEHAPHHCGY